MGLGNMNFNIYLKKNVAEKVTKYAKEMHRSWNSIINEALEYWFAREKTTWKKDFFDFDPITDVPDFKSTRGEFKNISEDTLA